MILYKNDFDGNVVLSGMKLPLGQDKFDEKEYNMMPLSGRVLYSHPLEPVFGNKQNGLSVAFGEGRIDEYAVFLIVYVSGIPYVYYPFDFEWLGVFKYLSEQISKDDILDILNYLVNLAVYKNEVSVGDLENILDYLEKYRINYADVYPTLAFWMIWFYYGCIAEEQYERNGKRTKLGGLIKVVAFIEFVYENYSLKDACDHYKADKYYDFYNESGSIVKAIKDKCSLYNVYRKIPRYGV